MTRTLASATLVLAVFLSSAPQASAGLDEAEGTINAGYDLYQLAFPFFPETAAATDSLVVVPIDPFAPIGVFDEFDVVSNPLGTFDFGDGMGAVDVGLADMIVRRDGDAISEFGSATVPIEIVALSLRSVEPVDVGGDDPEFLYVGLDSDPNNASTGEYEFFFFGPPDSQFVGDYGATFNLNYETRIGAADGPVFETGSVQMQTGGFGSTPFTHFPTGVSPFNAPDKLVDGVNFFLNGQNQEGDLFQSFSPLVVENVDDLSFFELAFEHANSDDPGDTAGNPVLPDEVDGTTFIFNDAPGSGWFDPPAASGYVYEMTSDTNFVSVFLPTFDLVPDADGEFIVSSIHGDVTVFAGTSYMFPTPVDQFVITGIDPTVDGSDPLAFPVFLTFDGFSNSFTQTPIPEPTAAALSVLGLAVWGARRRAA